MVIRSILLLLTAIIAFIKANEFNKEDIKILGIEPNSGPTTGETRVLVRLLNFDKDMIDKYPHPNCRFGSMKTVVNATFVKCSPFPRKVGEKEPLPEDKTEICIQCENTKAHTEDIIPFTVSLFGDFTDTLNSVPYRYYVEAVVTWIYPRYGPKDGGTLVEVYGENFLNYDQNLRCAFGSREVKAKYVSDNYLTCISPLSDVVQKKLPFSISFNNQQNSRQDINYVYYEYPQVFRLEPNRGPDTGGTLVRIRGQNFNPFIEIPEMNNANDTFCRFGNLSLTNGKIISSTEMDCVSPPSWEAREVPVEITLNNREWTNDGVLFYYYHPPFVYFINPKIGPVQGGTVVTITGSNFDDTGYVMCKFGEKFSVGTYVSQNELQCSSPPVERPVTVNLYVAIRPDEFSSGINTKYRYYDNPIIDYIEPMCGPERGFTQITVVGKNFPVGYSNDVKCVFNHNIMMNATIMNETSIKCDSPSVLNYNGVNENNITNYTVELTINSVDLNGPIKIFYYYKETFITGIKPIYGPVTGNTTVNITGFDFKQPGGCNVKARFATYETSPIALDHNYMIVKSPQANFTGAVVVQVALNGKQFEKDITVNFRDDENTFYYYVCPKTIEMKPFRGPTIGGNDIIIYGVGYDSPFYATKDPLQKILYYRFVDYDNEKIVYGQPKSTIVTKSHTVTLTAPNVYKNNTIARIQLSYNMENYCSYNQTYSFFVMPNITSVDPEFGPLDGLDKETKVKLDNYICTTDCDKIKCRFKSALTVYYEKGEYLSPNLIKCKVPKVNLPDSFNLEASFNDGDDFTNNGKNYTIYDPYVLKVIPQMVSSKGHTKIDIYGYGYANTGKNLKIKYGSSDNPITCDLKTCVTPGEYHAANHLSAYTYPRKEVIVDKTGETLEYQRFAVEVSVYNDDFTKNNVTIFYFDEPDVINDLSTIPNTTLSDVLRKRLESVLVRSLPANLETYIPIPVDSSKILKNYRQIEPYTNFTCRYEMEGKKDVKKVTLGIFTSYPVDSNSKNLFLCHSPEWEEVGKAQVRVSINGYDYSETYFTMNFTDPITLVKVNPSCGPLNGSTLVELYGTGFEKEKEYVFKWGPQNLVPMSENTFLGKIKSAEMSFIKESKFPIERIIVKSPIAPDFLNTHGGLDYIAISKLNLLPLKEFLAKYYLNSYIHTNFEYYYYQQIYVESFSPSGSIFTGGTQVMVIGAWFQNKPQYGMKPYCKFGEKIVEGIYLSTVRILCTAPEYPKPNVRVKFGVSLNKQDFAYAEKPFTYYNDFTHAKFEKILPTSGPSTGGTTIKIIGQNFTGMVTETEFQCQFDPESEKMLPRNVPAQYREYEDNTTAILCNTPGGWESGTKAKIKITFDGQHFMDTGFSFYFYKIDSIIPIAGPNSGVGLISINGGGFLNSSKVTFSLNHVDYKPLNIEPTLITNIIPKMNPNFTGYVDMALTLNGIDHNDYKDGFYYYMQPNITSIYPKTAPSKGLSKVLVFGELFRNDFRGAVLTCKVGNFYGRGEFVSSNEIICHFNELPLIMEESIQPVSQVVKQPVKEKKKKKGSQLPEPIEPEPFKPTYENLTIALNNVSFTESNLTLIAYGIESIEPSSGPISGGTRILVKGAGYYPSKHLRCRFGVPGYYAYTEGEYIDYNKMVCRSPKNFKIPKGGQLPFSVPFSIAFNEDEFSPWTETSHFFSFYKTPKIIAISPIEGKTNEMTTVLVMSDKEMSFSMPSATVVEEQYEVLPDNSIKPGNEEVKSKTTFSYQPILCRFGRFGTTEGEYLNRTLIKCLTPHITDDSDIGYEDVELEIALNGVDFVGSKFSTFTFIGPNAGKMLWIYILIIIFVIILILVLICLAMSYWNRIMLQYQGANAYPSDEPHVRFDRTLKYLQKDNLDQNLNPNQP